MKRVNGRPIVFGLMIVAVALSAFVYSGSSAPWAGSEYALAIPGDSTPAPPIVSAGTTTPTTMLLQFRADTSIAGVAKPTQYQIDIDGTTEAVQPSTSTERLISGLAPGSTHVYQVLAGWNGLWSNPTSLSVTQPKAPVSLGRASVPRSGKTKRTVKVSGTVSTDYPVTTAMPVKLKFYRLQKKGRRSVWVLRKSIPASRPSAASYAGSLKLKPAGTWSVIAETAGDAQHGSTSSTRSRSFKIR